MKQHNRAIWGTLCQWHFTPASAPVDSLDLHEECLNETVLAFCDFMAMFTMCA